MDFSVCMDMGHLLVHGIDLRAFYENWKDRITVVHLHGVDGNEDHLSLDRLSDEQMRTVFWAFAGTQKGGRPGELLLSAFERIAGLPG